MSGLLLAFPLESVLLRLALALGVALLLLRIVSGVALRSPRARTVLAATPFLVAGAVIVLSGRDLGLPSLLVPTGQASGALAVPVADRYLDFVPGAPLLVALWASVSVLLFGTRLVRARRFRSELVGRAVRAEPRIAALVLSLSRRIGIAPPRVLIVDDEVAGAAVVGVRDPLLFIDASTLEALDAKELEGVLAHELAHVARRDNLVAWAVSAIRDVAFFVPGARWAVQALHREREAAADQDAATLTGRPAALASGLLRVVELRGALRTAPAVPHGCAALAPASSVVDRVELLLAGSRPTAREHRLEMSLAAVVGLVAVALAVVLPTLLAGAGGERDALGVLVGPGAPGTASSQDGSALPDEEARVFAVYRSVGPSGTASSPSATAARAVHRSADVIGPEDRPGMVAACAAGAEACRTVGSGAVLALRPAPIVLVEAPQQPRWQATPVSETVAGERFGLFWLSRLDVAAGG